MADTKTAVGEQSMATGNEGIGQQDQQSSSTQTVSGKNVVVAESPASALDDSIEPGSKAAIWSMRFAVFADTIIQHIVGSNYALMVLPGGSDESFPTTKPFDFAAAYYFIPLCADVGIVISSLLFGSLSDKIGRKKCILICMYCGSIGCAMKYFARTDFWVFSFATFITGLFGGSYAVAAAWASDVAPTRHQKDAEIGALMAASLIGRAAGGVTTIQVAEIGLFAPLLWVSAPCSLVAGLLCHFFLHDKIHPQESKGSSAKDAENEVELDRDTLRVILAGGLADNLGSNGLIPFCISPLMFHAYYADFVLRGEEPIMSLTGYMWMYTLVAVIVTPGAMLSSYVFDRYGPAVSAITANLLTGVVTMTLLAIANAGATETTYVLFVGVLYVGFPLTIISQLAASPMLDRIAPESKRGKIQGYYLAVMNLAGAIGPFLLGQVSDNFSTDMALYTTALVCVLAAAINYPLSKNPVLGPSVSNAGNEDTSDSSVLSESDESKELAKQIP